MSDNGVFSKSELDDGTRTLIETSFNHGLSGKVLDLGCAIGTVGLVLKSLLNDLQVTMVDVQHNAVELAKENIKRLKLDGIEAYESDVVESVQTTFDYVLTNPPIRAGKAVVHQFFDGAYKVLKSNGVLLVVIRKSHGAPSAKVYLENFFGNCEILRRNKGFYILKSIKSCE
ncbi:MAG: class I SAM-dependent methyltransferase [Bacilli bacterium]|nr:class I SAM-dependent methyltransferase [Bacilli bacterium]